MRVTVPPFTAKTKARIDQLNEIRNHVRGHVAKHPNATEFETVVTWRSGDKETLVFDQYVGVPLGETYDEWLREWAGESSRV